MSTLVGRNKEIADLGRLYRSEKSQFVAIYGRRRVGKTFLVSEVFKNKLDFHHAGLSPNDGQSGTTLKEQLQAFHISLLRAGLDITVPCPSNWLQAFYLLSTLLETKKKTKKVVIFIDELPWLDTPKSGFISAFENFWNGWACMRDNILLIVCGSSTTWMLNNIINAQGGLYDRVTFEMKLAPFTLKECEEYFKTCNISLSRYDIVQSYMTVGGIPYYLSYFKAGLSYAQNVDSLFYSETASLKNEFQRLMRTLFRQPANYEAVVRFLAQRTYGFTRDEISQNTGISKGGGLSEVLSNLIKCDFIEQHTVKYPKKIGDLYKLTDPFCVFYLKFVDGNRTKDTSFWQNLQRTPKAAAFRGCAFELVCQKHISQIKTALGVSGVNSDEYPALFSSSEDSNGAQIDLIIDRADNVVNLCEMKFYMEAYSVTLQEEQRIENRITSLQKCLPKNKTIHATLISSFGLKYGEHSGVFQKSIMMDELFV